MEESMNRRGFLKASALAGTGLSLTPKIGTYAFTYPRPEKDAISLATWSLVRSFRAGIWKLTDIPRFCREDFGIDGIEFVNTFFELPLESYLNRLNGEAEKHGVRNVLIMVDGEGEMVSKEAKVRHQAVINHRKWVDIAAYLGCHAIRCNARGGGRSSEEDPDAIERAAESFSALVDYASESRINIIIENHGGLSSEPDWLPSLARKVNSPHFGILPDYGNYSRGTDIVAAVKMAMPYAKGVSVKAAWNPDGSHPGYDLEELLQVSKDSGYSGFWGIESSLRRSREDRPTTPEGIKEDDWKAVMLTKKAIQKVVFSNSY
jgi:sugar phosphate isomerase/epimerase